MVSSQSSLIFIAHETIYNEPDVVKETELDTNKNEPEPAAKEDEPEIAELETESDDEPKGVSLGDILGEPEDADEKDAEDYVEEKTTADGTHIRKEVHQGNGFKSVRITSDGGSGSPIPSMMGGGGPGGGIEDMMGAML